MRVRPCTHTHTLKFLLYKHTYASAYTYTINKGHPYPAHACIYNATIKLKSNRHIQDIVCYSKYHVHIFPNLLYFLTNGRSAFPLHVIITLQTGLGSFSGQSGSLPGFQKHVLLRACLAPKPKFKQHVCSTDVSTCDTVSL